MAQEFIYQQTIVQWRIPILENGQLGKPQLVGAFSPLYNGSQGYKQGRKPKMKPEEVSAEQDEEILL